MNSALLVWCWVAGFALAVGHENILEYLNDHPHFSSLVHLIIKAGLTSEMIADEPKTLFAPSNTAWQTLGNLTQLEKDKEHLRHLLQFHVVASPLITPGIHDGMAVPSLAGTNLKLSKVGGRVYVEDKMVYLADVITGNGIVHVLDSVMAIPATDVMGYLLLNNHAFSQFIQAVLKTDLQSTLAAGIHTLLVPTDAAFTAVHDRLPTDPASLEALLKNHIVDGAVFSPSLKVNDGHSVSGRELNVTTNSFGFISISGATVIQKDVNLVNGVIHVIDAVLL